MISTKLLFVAGERGNVPHFTHGLVEFIPIATFGALLDRVTIAPGRNFGRHHNNH